MTLEKLRDDDRVMQDRVRSQAVLFLQAHDELSEILTGNRVNRIAFSKEVEEALQHGFVLPMSVRLFERFDLLQVPADEDVQGRARTDDATSFRAFLRQKASCLNRTRAVSQVAESISINEMTIRERPMGGAATRVVPGPSARGKPTPSVSIDPG